MVKITVASGSIVEIQEDLYSFIRDEVLAGTDKTIDQILQILSDLVGEFGPKNQELLAKRADYQRKIDSYYIDKTEKGWYPTAESSYRDAEELEQFLLAIGYLLPAKSVDFQMLTPPLDDEMFQNGPELVTPVTNASMVVGGANARWGSLYDAYFLSDVRTDLDKVDQRQARLRMVVENTNAFLDEHVSRWQDNVLFGDITSYTVNHNQTGHYELVGHTSSGNDAYMEDPSKFLGFNLAEDGDLAEFFLVDNGLRIQCQLYPGGKLHPENCQFRDLIVESAITNIVDFEDSVAIVDSDEMIIACRNYLGVIKGTITARGSRGNVKVINSDKTMLDFEGNIQTLKGTSLMSVRNVSLHMYTNMILIDGHEIPARMLGVLITTLIATEHDNGSNGEKTADGFMPTRKPNSSKGYVYQVTPKLQTAEEVLEQVRLFERLEDKLALRKGTLLIGIMNEELGMTLQLTESLRMAQERVFFINTGFLDRTGSQIRVQMFAGPVNARDNLTTDTYNSSYEIHNVDIGIQSGVNKHGKIGKGMQVRNRSMAEMLDRKIAHPQTGGNTAWVPAPYPSDLHSMHYHMVDVDQIQRSMEDSPALNIPRHSLLAFPILDKTSTTVEEIKEDLLLRYLHSMVAYAEPWITRGIGCSGVPNFDHIEEMKDRATERIDSTILANWRLHGLITQEEIDDGLIEVARIVDTQNANTEHYVPIADTKAKRDNIFTNPIISSVIQAINDAAESPSAYVEPSLFKNRRLVKSP